MRPNRRRTYGCLPPLSWNFSSKEILAFMDISVLSESVTLKPGEEQANRQRGPKLEMKQRGAFDTDNKGFAVECGQDRTNVEKRQRKSNPDDQAVDWQPAQQNEQRHSQVAAKQQAGMVPDAEGLTKTHRQRQFTYLAILLIIAHIIHIQDSRDQEAYGDTGKKGQPGPARNLHIIGPPGHKQAHSEIDHDIAEATTCQRKRARAIEVGNCHTNQAKEDNSRADEIDQSKAEENSEHKAGHTAAQNLPGGHLLPKNYRA